MLPTFQLGSISINVPGLIILFSLWVGVTRAEDYGHKSGFAPAKIFNLCLFIIAGGLIGARLVYAVRYLDAFLANPGSLISPNVLMLDLSGGILGAILGYLIYVGRNHLSFLGSLDAVVPCLLVFSIGLGFSHLASGNAYGSPTKLPLGLYFWGANRFPTQVIEILLAAVTAYVLWPVNSRIDLDFLKIPGVRFLTFFVLAAFSRLLVEPLRGESVLLFGPFRSPQLLAFLVMLAALGLIAYLVNRQGSSE